MFDPADAAEGAGNRRGRCRQMWSVLINGSWQTVGDAAALVELARSGGIRPDSIVHYSSEPSPAAAEIVPDIVLVPLAAFDRAGHRIGYGGGHYDRTLAQLRKSHVIKAVGLGFAAQEVEVILALSHDVALDYVLTEKQVFDFRSG